MMIYAPIEEDRIAIQSLQIAVERLLSFDIFDIDSLDLRLVKQQILDILQRPIENHQDEV